VTFAVQHRSVYRVKPQTDSPRVLHQIRRAVHDLRCNGSDDAVHTVRFVVRFVAREQDALAMQP